MEIIVRMQSMDFLHLADTASNGLNGSSGNSNFSFTELDRELIMLFVERINQMFGTKTQYEILTHFSCATNDDWNETKFSLFNDSCDQATDETDLEYKLKTESQTHRILNKLLDNANENISRPKQGYRYDIDSKKFAVYIRMLSGPLVYNVLQQNLELALPSISTINKFIHASNGIVEGVLRCNELLLYLNDRNLPLVVGLSEDATRIEGKIQFDPRTNQLIGFVLPTDPNNGLPIPHVYKATSAEAIVEHFTNETPVATFVNTIMAQPISNAPPFCLLIFGTDGKYNAHSVSKRWKFVSDELKKLGITALSIASDSDPRYNCAMRANSGLGSQSDWSKIDSFGDAEWFRCGENMTFPFYFQDINHIGTKFRNFLMKTLKDRTKLPMGKSFYIRHEHLQHLFDHFPKDQHRLTGTCLNPVDRQNFNSVLRICDTIVIDLLKRHVKGSEATAKVLELLKYFLDAFMEISLSPLERIAKVWHSIFFIRLWRKFILLTKGLTLKKNFLTFYCYTCLEQNAHSLIMVLLYLHRENRPDLFLPFLFSSQPCEEFYRKIRSMSPTYSTVVNCSVKGFLARISNTKLQSDIGNDNLSKFIFPQCLKSKNLSNLKIFPLPNVNQILEVIEEAKLNANKDAQFFGLMKARDEGDIAISCEVDPYSRTNSKYHQNMIGRSRKFDKTQVLNQLKTVRLKNYAEKFESKSVEISSTFTEIPNAKKRIIVKKSSLCWLLREDMPKLSSDRQERVKAGTLPLNLRINLKVKSKEKKVKLKQNHSTVVLSKFIKPRILKNK